MIHYSSQRIPQTLLYRADGQERRIGVELEYIGLPLLPTAQLIVEFYGGEIVPIHKNEVQVRTRSEGNFRVIVDADLLQSLSKQSQKNITDQETDWEGTAEAVLNPMYTAFLPNEVVSPPLSLSQLSKFDQLLEPLRLAGAKGTEGALHYAFGLHLNPEVVSHQVESILPILQVFILLFEWIKHEMNLDLVRQITSFTTPFPHRYAKLVLDDGYHPDMATFINDYLEHNPTRNRALDLLNLMAEIDEPRVRKVITDSRLNPRPTFHYRLPDCKLDDPEWSVMREWKIWEQVELISRNDTLRSEMISAYWENKAQNFWEQPTLEWIDRCAEWVETL